MSVEVKGLDAVLRFINELPQVVKEAGDSICLKAAIKAEVEARRIVPFRTGALMRSITTERIGDGEYKVGSSLVYAPFVEFGTSKMRAQPYLRPAVETVFASLPSEVQEILEAKIKITR